MRLVVGVAVGDAREEVLIDLAGQQVAVGQRVLAEIGQQVVARRIGRDREAARIDRLRIAAPTPP
jgi:hypothetical protein